MTQAPAFPVATIRVRWKSVFGKDLIYVVDRNHAIQLEALTHKKTLDQRDLLALVELGIHIEWVTS